MAEAAWQRCTLIVEQPFRSPRGDREGQMEPIIEAARQ
jgi:hypothetical protein